LRFAEAQAHADDGAAGADPADQGVRDHAVRQLGERFRAEPGAVLLDVPLRIELLRREVSRLAAELGDLGQRVVDVKVTEGHHLCAEGPRDRQPFAAHPVRHDHQHPVALDGGDHAHRVSGIAAAGLHDGVTRGEQPFPLGPLDHVLGDPRLD
jgi:hypothetical protein